MDARKLIDPELLGVVDLIPYDVITRDNLAEVRASIAAMGAGVEAPKFNVSRHHRVITIDGNNIALQISVPDSPADHQAGLIWLHGGGYIMGDADDDFAPAIAEACGCTVFSVDYRVAPEHPFPAGCDDGYNALNWVSANASEFGLNPDRLAIGGVSAGAGLAAGVCLMSRDRGGVQPAFQLLLYPMLDNLHATASGQIENHPVWNRQTSFNAWEMYLDGNPGSEASPYAAPSRAKDLSGLPTTYITVGTQDLFRDENIEYAQRLMVADVATQLEVFPGVFHAAENFVPQAKISQRMRRSYLDALSAALLALNSQGVK
ncbi:MAG: alpha/beta hydrolase [Halioglobus sp.]